MSKIRIAVIGFGKQTQEEHYQEIIAHPEFEVVGIVDPQQTGYEPHFSSLEELLSTTQVDAALVATPHVHHLAITTKLLERQIPVLKEKPFAMSLQEAVEMHQLATEMEVPLLINVQRRLQQHYIEGLNLLPQIGNPFLVEGVYHLYVDNPHVGWRGKKALAGGGCIIDMGYHMIDLINLYLGLPDSITGFKTTAARPDANYDAEDTATLLLGYGDTAAGYLSLSRSSAPKHEFLKITGDAGTLMITREYVLLTNAAGEEIKSVTATDNSPSSIHHFYEVISHRTKDSILTSEHHLSNMAFVDAAYQAIEKKTFINPHKLLEEV